MMTFDEWMLTVAPAHKPSDDSVTLRILRACWKASEDAARERCARIVETQDTNGDHVGGWFELLAAKIRA